jgi:uncharacterized protein (TIGR02300 family)
MPAKDLGAKHTCYQCGTRFYDLKKPAPICPKCGADQRHSPAQKSPAAGERRRAAPKPPAEPVLDVVPEDVEEDAKEPVDEDEEESAGDDES